MAKVTWWTVARDALIVVLCVTAAFGAATGISERLTPQYRSVSRMLVTPNKALYDGRDLLTALDTLNRTSLLATYVEVLNSARIQRDAASAIGIGAAVETYDLRAVVLPGANILEVRAEGPDPTVAANLVNSAVSQGVDYIEARYAMFQIDVLDPASAADEPYSPDVRRNGVLAAVLAAGVAILLISLLGYRPLLRREAYASARGHAVAAAPRGSNR